MTSSNPFYNTKKNGQNMGMSNNGNIFQKYKQFMQNPFQFLAQNNINIPQEYQTGNPQDVMNYLINSGQINKNQINQLSQLVNSLNR